MPEVRLGFSHGGLRVSVPPPSGAVPLAPRAAHPEPRTRSSFCL